jgi:hypothetical protein
LFFLWLLWHNRGIAEGRWRLGDGFGAVGLVLVLVLLAASVGQGWSPPARVVVLHMSDFLAYFY